MRGNRMYDFTKFATDAKSSSYWLDKAYEYKAMMEKLDDRGDHREARNYEAFMKSALRQAKAAEQRGDELATDPAVSQAQRAAMGAAASGNSNLGIPKSVGKEFIDKDPGGKLPARKR